MGWIVFGIIAFVVTLWVWRHTYTGREKVYDRAKRDYFDHPPYHWEYRDEDRAALPRWAFLLVFVVYMVPCANLVVFMTAFIFFIGFIVDGCFLFFHVEGNRFTRGILAFLTKDVFAKKKSE